MQIILKEALKEESMLIRECNKKCLPVYYPLYIYRNYINSNKSIILIAKTEERVIGYIIGELSDEKPERFHIISFGVCQEYRKNKLGTILMNKIIKLAKLRYNKITKISLYVMKSNSIAIKFYKTIGFYEKLLLKNYYSSFNQDGYLYIKNL